MLQTIIKTEADIVHVVCDILEKTLYFYDRKSRKHLKINKMGMKTAHSKNTVETYR